MSKTFKGFRIHEIDGRIVARFDELTLDDLAPGEVVVRVLYSDINYKDALAATGAGRILRRYPLVGGIDLAGVVESSEDPRCKPGDHVVFRAEMDAIVAFSACPQDMLPINNGITTEAHFEVLDQ